MPKFAQNLASAAAAICIVAATWAPVITVPQAHASERMIVGLPVVA